VSLSDELLPLLSARAPTILTPARLLEMFTRADEISSDHPPERVGDVEISKVYSSVAQFALLCSTLHVGT